MAEAQTVEKNSAQSRQRRAAIMELLAKHPSWSRQQVAEEVLRTTGIPCSDFHISNIRYQERIKANRHTGTRSQQPKPAAPRIVQPQQQHMHIVEKPSLEKDLARVQQHMLTLGIEAITIAKDGTIHITKKEIYQL